MAAGLLKGFDPNLSKANIKVNDIVRDFLCSDADRQLQAFCQLKVKLEPALIQKMSESSLKRILPELGPYSSTADLGKAQSDLARFAFVGDRRAEKS